jgi:hypothetical protein
MIWTIALGILLGYILIQLLPDFFTLISNILHGTSEFINEIFKIIYNLWKALANLKWYYKLLVFVFLFFVFASTEQVYCLLALIIIYSYFVGKFIIKYINKLKKWNTNAPKKDFEEI